jgi:hypothetical protein
MASTVNPAAASDKLSDLELRLGRLESVKASVGNQFGVATPPRQSLWITNLLQGVTLVTIAASAFWLGSLSSTVSSTSAKVDRLTDAVSGSKDSLSSRASVIETKLDEINKKFDNR